MRSVFFCTESLYTSICGGVIRGAACVALVGAVVGGDCAGGVDPGEHLVTALVPLGPRSKGSDSFSPVTVGGSRERPPCGEGPDVNSPRTTRRHRNW
jgi:hypothetical protein